MPTTILWALWITLACCTYYRQLWKPKPSLPPSLLPAAQWGPVFWLWLLSRVTHTHSYRHTSVLKWTSCPHPSVSFLFWLFLPGARVWWSSVHGFFVCSFVKENKGKQSLSLSLSLQLYLHITCLFSPLNILSPLSSLLCGLVTLPKCVIFTKHLITVLSSSLMLLIYIFLPYRFTSGKPCSSSFKNHWGAAVVLLIILKNSVRKEEDNFGNDSSDCQSEPFNEAVSSFIKQEDEFRRMRSVVFVQQVLNDLLSMCCVSCVFSVATVGMQFKGKNTQPLFKSLKGWLVCIWTQGYSMFSCLYSYHGSLQDKAHKYMLLGNAEQISSQWSLCVTEEQEYSYEAISKLL